MICRIWHGWTTRENADAYERLLKSEIFHGITERRIPGYRGIELLRRNERESVEFVTLMWFDSLADPATRCASPGPCPDAARLDE
jgi:heme-degrading monooxygenase HmoA